MMRLVVQASLKFRLLVVVAAVGLLAVGVARLNQMPVDVYPEFAQPSVEIQTEALGLSAAEVEQLLTVPLEADVLNGVAWVDKITSKSIAGLSSITLRFQPGTNLLRARQLVQEHLNTPAAIPNVSKAPVMLPPVSSTSRTMMIGLSSDKLTPIDMGVLARWTIRPRLMGVQGVSNVSIWGQRERQLQVQVDPRNLKDKGVSLAQVISTAGNSLWVSSLSFLEASSPGTGGFFDAPNQRLAVRHVSPIIGAADLAKVPVEPGEDAAAATAPDGSPLRLGDVANVVEDHQPLIGDAIVNGKPGLMLVVEKLPTANTLKVTKGIEDALEALRPGLKGLDVDPSVFRPATSIHKAINDVGAMLLVGFALVVLALALLFYQWRTALVAVMSIVTSAVVAGLILYVRGSTFNTLVFAGLVAGLAVVIDEAIIGAENVARRLRERREAGSSQSVATTVLDATLEMRRGMAFATAVLLLPLLPVLFLDRVGSAFGRPLAISYMLALGVAMAVAVTVTPALAVFVFAKAPLGRRESPLMGWLAGRYQTVLSRGLGSARPAIATLAVIALAGLVVVPGLRQSPVPTFKETDFLVNMAGPPGMSLPEMDRITSKAAGELRSLPGVRNVGGHIGRAVTSDKVLSPNSSVLWVSVDPQGDYDRTVASVRRVVKGYPGIETELLTYSEERLKEARETTDKAVVVRIFGQQLEPLRQSADKVTAALAGTRGVTDLHAVLPREEPTLEVEVNLEAAKKAGIKPGDVRRAAATLISGVQVGSLFEEEKVFDVVVWGTPGTRQNVSNIRDLLIDTPDGTQVRLGTVADVQVKPAPSVILRDAVSRYVDVTAGVKGRDRSAVLAEVKQRLAKVNLPPEYHYELVGNYAAHHAVGNKLLVVGIIAAIGIFLLLQATFGSWALAALAFLTVPLALVGGALAARINGGTVEFGSLIGLLAIFGIALRNGVILIKRYQHLEGSEGEPFGRDLVVRGARERLAPVLITATATGLAFLPFVLRGNIPGHEIVHPMGAVILGGLVTAMIVNLFLIPALYLRVGSRQGEIDVIDLRDLWEITQSSDHAPAALVANGHVLGNEAGPGTLEVGPQ